MHGLLQWIQSRRDTLNEMTDMSGIVRALVFGDTQNAWVFEVLREMGWVHLTSASGVHLAALFAVWSELPKKSKVGNRWGALIFFIILGTLWLAQGFRPGFGRIIGHFFLRQLQLPFMMRTGIGVLTESLFDFFHLSPYPLLKFGGWHYYGATLGAYLFRGQGHWGMAVGSWIPFLPFQLFEGGVAHLTPIASWITGWGLIVLGYPALILSALISPHAFAAVSQSLNVLVLEFLRIHDILGGVLIVARDQIFYALWGTLAVGLFWRIPRAKRGWTTGPPLNPSRSRFFPGYLGSTLYVPAVLGLLLWCWIVRIGLGSDTVPKLYAAKPEFAQWDVGQGDAAWIRSGELTYAIDFGSQWDFNNRPVRWLRRIFRWGNVKMQGAVLTHADEDHRGGLRWARLFLGVSCLEEWEAFQGRGKWCVPWPSMALRSREKRARGNQKMLGFWIPLSGQKTWLTLGDADHSQEAQFLKAMESTRPEGKLWLKLSHHGSRHSSSAEFLNKLKPNLVVISAGKFNRHGHPHVQTLERLESLRIPWYRTDQTGDFIVEPNVQSNL